jgi:four helix bundle protein
MNPKALSLQERTHKFFMDVVRLCEDLPANDVVFSVRPQLLDSAGSTDSNYRATCRARSRDEFIAKVGTAAEEADESKGWLMKLLDTGYGDRHLTSTLLKEADELTAIFTKSHKTAKRRRDAQSSVVNRRRSQRP